ncbi:putative vacuolar sorting protein SNF7 family protein [Aspergillus saccharolyticus JOP 1030-1]|uniref:SNF7 family protein n=1 Tax=Aspergillus saccharolyticus JOP 1030-1 TaxID=1450539 RepID=A0A318Z2P4_9EURO|nr:SNF7 family protein [Aspergillus saccharolyticus JOP 1030-1]PYH41571.1 SNF7 family protein [Aspergillus saccharolyticus JOP 1030-1]
MNDLLEYILSQDQFRKNRLPSLYSDFPIHRKINPEGYTTNIAAWQHALTSAAKHGYIRSPIPTSKSQSTGGATSKANHLILRADESLLRDLEIPEWGRPVALGAVFDEAVRNRTMVPLQMYKNSGACLQKPGWGIDTSALSPWVVMSWGMKQLKGVVLGSEEATPRLQAQELVLVENLKETAERVVKKVMGHHPSKTDLVYSREKFMEEFATILDEQSQLSNADMDVLLLYLSRDSGAIAYDGKTIRFRPSNDSPREITEQDTAVASIKSLMATMTKQVESLEKKIDELNVTAKTALQSKNRVSALSAVRSKKLAEHNLKQRLDTLMQLEEVYSKIEQAADQVEFVRVMESSAGALRGLHAQIGGAARVEDVVEELRDEMTKVDEVGNILNEAAPHIDEMEIDEELEELENREREAREEKEAEEIRKKLAELDNLEQRAQEAARSAAAEKDLDSELEERLSRMSVEEGPSATAQ